jgi:hypothetical protein
MRDSRLVVALVYLAHKPQKLAKYWITILIVVLVLLALLYKRLIS